MSFADSHERLAVVGLLAAFIYALVMVAQEWSGPLRAVSELHLEARYLPQYALASLARGVMAYGVLFKYNGTRRVFRDVGSSPHGVPSPSRLN